MTRSRAAAVVVTAQALLLVALASRPSRARADEPWMLGVRVSAAFPLGAPQSELFTPGAGAEVLVLRALGPVAAVGVRAEALVLGDGSASPNGLQDPGVGGLFAAGALLRLRPGSRGGARTVGPWLEAGIAAGLTGVRVRPVMHGGAGWSFPVGAIGLGPAVRFEQVLAFEGIDPRDSRTLWAGLELVLGDVRPPPPREAAPAPTRSRGRANPIDGDGDRDGVRDSVDACASEPEDRDGFADADGCPDPDDDRDGILDVADSCPREAEVVNEIDDRDGCPDRGLVELEGDRVVLDERVLFDFERARVRHAARPVLQAIERMIAHHPEWSGVSIEGHADVRGHAEFNQVLSERRARAVLRVLEELGVRAALLSAVGWGASHPRDSGNDETAYQRNRRVEFVVTGPGIRPREAER